MFSSLNPGHVGISASLREGLALAERHGFGGYDAQLDHLHEEVIAHGATAVRDLFLQHGLRIGAWNLPFMPYRVTEAEWRDWLAKLPPLLASARALGALRAGMFDLYKIQPFKPILLVSENVVDGRSKPCHTAQETHAAAQSLVKTFLSRCPGATNDDCIIDPGIAPIGSDSEGHLRRIVEAMTLIHQDPDFRGVHMSVGLSNFTVMLPPKRPDGSPTKGPLESAFLTLAMLALSAFGLAPADVLAELQRREGLSGLEEFAARKAIAREKRGG